MTNRENYLNIARRKGYEKMPVHLEMCPSLQNKFAEYCRKTGFSYTPVHVHVPDLIPVYASDETFLKFYDHNFKSGTFIEHTDTDRCQRIAGIGIAQHGAGFKCPVADCGIAVVEDNIVQSGTAKECTGTDHGHIFADGYGFEGGTSSECPLIDDL